MTSQFAPAAYSEWIRLVAGLSVVFLLFHGLAQALGSFRGEAGLVVAGAVTAALLAVEGVLFRQAPGPALRSLGFGWPAGAGLLAAFVVCMVLLATLPVCAWLRGVSLSVYPAWAWLLPGLFAQAGIAEEALFRGYLFGRLRRGRTFWRAAALAAVPFVLVHVILFATMPWPVALAAVLLATIMSFPLARLFELGGNTIWAPALLHATAQGAIKVLELPGYSAMPLVWMAASAAIPYLVFLWRFPSQT
ncbi:MAG TPA: CPBP family intramembrane glutamic endopeptidase [Hyphomicrobiaceae bacterium]|nr:CPBP family intramembrane glutamic endopeptidase [Hyphomicrobiaceae bacterium]